MKKIIGMVLMVVGVIFLCLLIAAEIKLFKDGNAPTSVFEWIGNLIPTALSIIAILVGNKLRKN